MRRLLPYIFLLAVPLLHSQVLNQPGPAYVYASWRMDHGLPSNDIRGVFQSAEDYIWIATVKGLVRFDGVTFNVINLPDTRDSAREIVGNICEDKDHHLWFAIDFAGLVCYNGGSFASQELYPELRTGLIAKTFLDKQGRLWVGARGGLYVASGGTLSKVAGFDHGIADIGQDIYGNILILSNGLYAFSDKGVRKITVTGDPPTGYSRLGIGSDGMLLIAGEESLYKISVDPGKLQWRSRRYTFKRRVTSLLEESPGVFFVASYGSGVERLSQGELSPIRGLESLQGAALNIRQLTRGKDSSIWLSTGGGLIRMRKSFIWTISKNEGIPENHIWSVGSSRDGSLWAGAESKGAVNFYHGKPRTILTKSQGLSLERVTAILEVADGSVWFGGHPQGLIRKTGGRLVDMSKMDGYVGGSVRAMFQDHLNRIWIGTSAGLSCYDGSKFRSYPDVAHLATQRVNAIQEDINGDLWISAGTILRLHGDSLSNFKAGGSAGKFPAWSMYVDTGRVWFGTYGSGLHLIQGDSVISMERYTREFGPDILSIREDDYGKLWINAEHELQSISKQTLLDVVAGKRPRLDPRVYGTLDGLSDIEFNGTGMHSSCVGPDGTFIYASMNGIVVVAPKLIPTTSLVPPVHIERLLVDGREFPLTGSVDLPAGTKRIDITFSALTFESVPKVKMRYRLEGIDEDWRDLPSLRRSVSFMNVQHGSYVFRVIAANAEGDWNSVGATLRFTVDRYLYESPAFIAFAFILAAALLYGGFRWRIASLRDRQLILSRIVDEKTAALTEEISIRRRTEDELRSIQADLELRVEERTAQLSSAVEDLRRSREQYQSIVETAQEGILLTDANDGTLFVNPKMAEILGERMSDLIGGDICKFLDSAGKEMLEKSRKRHRDGLADRFELEFTRSDGSRVWTAVSATPILDHGGEYQGSLSMIADISSQKKSEAEHQRVEEELRQAQKMEAVGQLAGGIAHDFNNLLIPILGYSEMLQKDLAAKELSLKRITTIKRAAEKAALLTKQLLSFSRRQVMESKVINLNRIITDFSPILQRTIREDVEIKYVLSDDLFNIRGDSSQIDQILINLLVNAQDAMPGGGAVTVETTNAAVSLGDSPAYGTLQPGRYVALVVTDSGKGIPPEVVDHIFEPFFTTKDKSKGTGLGLATVYGIVKQHSGHIWVDSTVGVGTSFTVYFPADPGSTPLSSDFIRPREAPLSGTASIVVMEDDDLVRQFARTILEDSGYHVHDFGSVELCLKFFRESGVHVDLLLTDVVMPVMNGRELHTTLSREFPGLKVVYMSGYSNDVISHSGILEEGVILIEKPFTPETLLKRIQKVLM